MRRVRRRAFWPGGRKAVKISTKLEEMVADLVSDEKSKREEVEAVLSQIHSLTEAYFNPEKKLTQKQYESLTAVKGPDGNWQHSVASAPVTPDRELESQRKLFEAKGIQPEEALRRAKGILGIE
jgi:hypothetical protein